MKELKGKARTDFEKWMKPTLEHGRYGQLITNTFENMTFSLQSGVILEWLDSVGLHIIIGYDWNRFDKIEFYGCVLLGSSEIITPQAETRQEALKEAIIKAVELINK